MNLVYLVFGNSLDHFQQVYFSIFTAFARLKKDEKIIVVTDNASLFQFFEDKIEIIPINKEIIKEWEGPHQFFWRVKIKALQLVAEKYPSDSILYLDGDTFFYNDVDALRNGLEMGQNYMHLPEGKLADLSSKTEKLMLKQMNGKTYHGVKIDGNSTMWNAGLIGISKKHFDCLKLTLEINDAMCADHVTRRLVEQFAFSLGLNQYSSLKAADDSVGHYWGNKSEWNIIITQFLKKSFMEKYSLEEIVQQVKGMDLIKTPIWVKESNTERKLKNLVGKFFQSKKQNYINK